MSVELYSPILDSGVVNPSDLPVRFFPSPEPDPLAYQPVTDPVEVTEEPKVLAWTRGVYSACLDCRASMALERIQQGLWIHQGFIDVLGHRPQWAKPQLRSLMRDEKICARGRVRAAHALARLGCFEGEDFIVEALDPDDKDLCVAALELLGHWQCTLDLTEPVLARRILSLLSSHHPEIDQQVVRLCRQEIPGAEDCLREYLVQGRGPVSDLAETLACIATQPETIQILLPHLFHEQRDRSITSIRYSFGFTLNHPEPEVRAPLCQFLQQNLLRSEGEERFDPHWVSELSAVADEGAIPILEQIINQAPNPVSRAYGLEGLSRLQPERAVSLILEEIEREHPWSFLLQLLAEYACEEDFEQICTVVYSPARRSRDLGLEDVRLLVDRLGSQGRDWIIQNWEWLDKLAQEWVTWKLEDLTVEDALWDFYEAGVLHQSVEELMAELILEDSPLDLNDPRVVVEALGQAGLLTYFDTESQTQPCQHGDLIHWFGLCTAEAFTPECPVQIWPSDQDNQCDSAYLVHFIFRGRLYRFEAENYGEYYDVESVVGALNFALEDQDFCQRFIGLYTGDQCSCFVFADPEQFLPLAQRYGLALSDHALEGMWAGKAFDHRLIA